MILDIIKYGEDKYNKLRASGLSKEKARRRLGL